MLFYRYLKYTLFLVIYLLSVTTILGQPMSQRQDHNRTKQIFSPSLFSFDTYFFMSKEEGNKSRMDVYVAFANDILQFVKEKQGNYSAGYELLVSVFDKKGNLVGQESATKKIMAKNLIVFLEPIHEKREYYKSKPDLVDSIFADGTEKARGVAQQTMAEVRQAMKIA